MTVQLQPFVTGSRIGQKYLLLVVKGDKPYCYGLQNRTKVFAACRKSRLKATFISALITLHSVCWCPTELLIPRQLRKPHITVSLLTI